MIKDEIIEKIRFLVHDAHLALTVNTPLVSSGLLSSMNIVELAAWIEGQYSIDFAAQGFNVYDFDTVDSIVRFIEDHPQPPA